MSEATIKKPQAYEGMIEHKLKPLETEMSLCRDHASEFWHSLKGLPDETTLTAINLMLAGF